MNTKIAFCRVGPLLASLALNVLPVTPSFAAPATQGAYTFKDDYCFSFDGTTVCYANQGMVIEVNTPSGHNNFVGNGSSSYSETDSAGDAQYSNAISYHTEGQTIEGVLKQMGQAFSGTLEFGSVSCTTRYHFQFANGQIIFERGTDCQ